MIAEAQRTKLPVSVAVIGNAAEISPSCCGAACGPTP